MRSALDQSGTSLRTPGTFWKDPEHSNQLWVNIHTHKHTHTHTDGRTHACTQVFEQMQKEDGGQMSMCFIAGLHLCKGWCICVCVCVCVLLWQVSDQNMGKPIRSSMRSPETHQNNGEEDGRLIEILHFLMQPQNMAFDHVSIMFSIRDPSECHSKENLSDSCVPDTIQS